MTKVCAIYARQSIEKPDSISIESQIEQCLYEVKGDPYQVYCDRGYSGKNTDRPQFQAMLNAICNGEIERVICYKLDRCSRSILDFTQLMKTLQQYGVEFISCTEKFDTGTPMGRAMLNICIVFAQLERETIQQRITDTYHSRCKKGFFMGGRIPFGYSLVPHVLEGKKTARYEIVPEEAEIIAHIYGAYSDPTSSLSDVVISLKENNIVNPRREDGLWVRSHIGRMIKNPIYVKADHRVFHYYEKTNALLDNPIEDYIGENGCYCYKISEETHLVLAPHRGIVSSNTWLQCQNKAPKKLPTRNGSRKSSWLAGKLKCCKCSRCVITKQTIGKNGRTYRYFMCPGSNGKARQCDGFGFLSAGKIEARIASLIVSRVHQLSKHQIQNCQNTLPSEQLQQTLLELVNACKVRGNSFRSIEQTLLELSTQLKSQRQDHDASVPLCDNNHWEHIRNCLSQWDTLSNKQMSSIADMLITSVQLRKGRMSILWRY